MSNLAQEKLKFVGKVFEVFTQVQKLISPHQTHIFQLAKYFNENNDLFYYSFEQAYLKIFKNLTKSNKKIHGKFQTLAEQFFENILPLQKSTGQLLDYEPEIKLLNNFLALCSEGMNSTVMNIRILSARLMFLLIKLIPPKQLQFYLIQTDKQKIFEATLNFVKTKIATYRQLGVKISSLILHLQDEEKSLEEELFKIMSVEDNEQIRKMVITNITITKSNLDNVLIRLRDKNPQIRSIIVKKLQGEHFNLYDMTINQVYKLLYDGYGSKQLIVKRECVRYFAMFFTQKRQFQTQSKHKQFINLFRPELLLLNPHLYLLFNELIGDLLEEVESSMMEYIKKICYEFKNQSIQEEIIWLKNSMNSESKEISKIYEEFGPTGLELAKTLLELSKSFNIFSLSELLQLFASQTMPQEIGRNKMFDALKQFLYELPYATVPLSYHDFIDSDICHKIDQSQLERKKLLLSYYDMPIINNSLDLIFLVGEAMRNLRPEHYQIEMKQIMAEWHNPEENTLRKEKQLLEANIEQIRKKGNSQTLQILEQKYQSVIDAISHENEKAKKVLVSISRLRHNCDLESYLSVIKEELSKEKKANGLILLGLYCLENIEKVSQFWKTYWDILNSTPTNENQKNNLLVSIKVITDFIVKFNTLCQPNFKPYGIDDFNSDMFMDCMMRLILNNDSDIRILAIECLCRLIYHQRVDENNLYSYFLYLLLLWLQTSKSEICSRSVHTISIFMKSYMQKGNKWVLKLAQVFCIFFKVLLKFQMEGKGINKSIIKYNLTTEEFIRKIISMVLTVLKYQKEKNENVWKYNPNEPQMGPQQFVLLLLLTEEELTQYIGKGLVLCDFYELCSLEVLIIMKKIMENINETRKYKGAEQIFKKFQTELQSQISLKNSDTFNENIVDSLQKENQEKMKLLTDESRRIHKNLQQQNLFIQIESDSEGSEEDGSDSSQEDDLKSDLEEDKEFRKKTPRVISLESQSSVQQHSSSSNLYTNRLRRKRK